MLTLIFHKKMAGFGLCLTDIKNCPLGNIYICKLGTNKRGKITPCRYLYIKDCKDCRYKVSFKDKLAQTTLIDLLANVGLIHTEKLPGKSGMQGSFSSNARNLLNKFNANSLSADERLLYIEFLTNLYKKIRKPFARYRIPKTPDEYNREKDQLLSWAYSNVVKTQSDRDRYLELARKVSKTKMMTHHPNGKFCSDEALKIVTADPWNIGYMPFRIKVLIKLLENK